MIQAEPFDIELRPATLDDVPRILGIIEPSITELLGAVLAPELVERSRAIMGLDRTLIEDGSYWVAVTGGALCGCGGWSRRGAAYGGDHSAGRDARLLDPASEPARIRAMYTPRHSLAGGSARPFWRGASPRPGTMASGQLCWWPPWPACRSIGLAAMPRSRTSRTAASRWSG